MSETGAVSIRLTRPDPADLEVLRIAGEAAPLTYEPVGMSALAVAPRGYRLDRWSRVLLGRGERVFERASNALLNWDVHRGAGLVVCADGPASVGSVVAMAAPLPVGFVDVVCRVVDVIDADDRAGFVYGTLPVHPERGEEALVVVRHDDQVTFEITACSRLRHPLARTCPPAARFLQRAATKRYLDAMESVATQ